MNLLFCFLVIWMPAPSFSAADRTDLEEFVFKANEAYKDGRFQDAVNGYRRILELNQPSGHLYYNLANAYFRLDDIGRAVLFYERARLLMPRDADLNFNLSYVRDQTRDVVIDAPGFLESTFFWVDDVGLTDLFWVFALIHGLFFALLSLRLFSRAEWTYYGLFVLIVFETIAAGSFALKWHQVHHDRRAVVLREEVEISAGPDTRDTVLFRLHAGAIVHYERSEDEWSLIHLSKDKRGWIKSEDIEGVLCRIEGLRNIENPGP